MSDEVLRQIGALGKGIVQINARLSRLTQLVEAPTAGRPDVLEPLLDLLQALEDALASEPNDGLRIARDAAIDALMQRDIHPIPTAGAFDARLHAATAAVPGPVAGQIAATSRRGWYKAGDPPTVLRVAEVTVTAGGER